jgi:hypothetical protein
MTAAGVREPKAGTAGGTQPMASLLLRWAAGAGALLLIAALLYFAWVDLRCARSVLADPFGIDYGEGIVWQQALLIPGPRMYGRIDHLPFIVFHYPPVYHLVSRALMSFGVDPLAAGRMVSVAATAVIAISIAWLVAAGLERRVGRPAVLMGSVTGALLLLSLRPVEWWFDLMRVDMLAVALAFLGVVFAVRAERQPAWLTLAMPAFVLSIYTKQTELAAPAAALAVLFMVRPRATTIAGIGGVILGLAALAWLEWLTAGGFIRHILYYNVNTWSFDSLVRHLRSEKPYAVLLVAAIVGLAVSWLDRGVSAIRLSAGMAKYTVVVPMVSVWLLLSIVMLATVGKTGSNVNYFIEPMGVCAIGAGLLIGVCSQAVFGSPSKRDIALRLGLVCVTLAFVVEMAKYRPFCVTDYFEPRLITVQENLVRKIAKQDRPVLSEDMVLLLRAGKEVPIEPSIFRELTETGQWDQRRILDLIDSHAFAFLVTTPNKIDTPERFTPEMLAAIARGYPHLEADGPYVVHYPEGP